MTREEAEEERKKQHVCRRTNKKKYLSERVKNVSVRIPLWNPGIPRTSFLTAYFLHLLYAMPLHRSSVVELH
jgi:hypothetical protein